MPIFVDHSGRAAGTRALRTRGIALAVFLVIAALIISAYAQGKFADRFRLTIDAATIGEGLAPGAEVKLHGFAIGRVSKIDTVGFGHQRIELELDRRQAAELTDNVSAQFTSSNVFGSTAIELINKGGGAKLAENTTLSIGENSTNATVTSVFRQAGRLTKVLDSEQVQHLFDLIIENTKNLGPTVGSFFETARILADNQKAPLGHYLRIGAENSEGAEQVTPVLVEQILGLLDQAEYFGDEANRQRTAKALSGLGSALIDPVGDLLARNNPDLSKIIDTLLDLVVPIAASLGTLAPTYNRIPELIDRIGAAFPVVDGRVQLQLEVIAKNMPYLTNSIIGGPGGGTR